jgi:predicted GNAT superfamily acetyltransferase
MAAGAGVYRIRDLHEYEEFCTCVAIQQRTWGADFAEIVPAAILWAASRTGGVVAGAFDDGGRMVGFVFGISGFRDGRPVHWSDMLAVLPEARGSGLGRTLKEHQRRTLLANGIEDVYWTFDPLESRNAHINFAHLGIIAQEYVPDCYGASTSPLHSGLATDRLVAYWPLAAARVRERMEGRDGPPSAVEVAALPVINGADWQVRQDLDGPRLRLRVPADIQQLKQNDPAQARQWRATTRQAFQHYIGRGYLVLDLVRESPEWSSYLLVEATARPAALFS